MNESMIIVSQFILPDHISKKWQCTYVHLFQVLLAPLPHSARSRCLSLHTCLTRLPISFRCCSLNPRCRPAASVIACELLKPFEDYEDDDIDDNADDDDGEGACKALFSFCCHVLPRKCEAIVSSCAFMVSL